MLIDDKENLECTCCNKVIKQGDVFISVLTCDSWQRPCCSKECAEKIKKKEIDKGRFYLEKVKNQTLIEKIY